MMSQPDPEWANPYAPPPSREDARLAPEATRHSKNLGILVAVHGATMAIGLICQLLNVEWITVIGPVFCLTGVLLGVKGQLARRGLLAWAGWSAIAYACLVIALINLFEWSPDEAAAPLAGLSSAYSAGVAVIILVWLLQPADARPHQPTGPDR